MFLTSGRIETNASLFRKVTVNIWHQAKVTLSPKRVKVHMNRYILLRKIIGTCNRRLPVSARNRHQPRRSLPPALISESPVSWSRRQLLRNTGGRGVRGAGIESLHLCFDAGVLVMKEMTLKMECDENKLCILL